MKKLNRKELYKLRQKGLTLQAIGNKFGVKRQAIFEKLKTIKRCPKCGEIIN